MSSSFNKGFRSVYKLTAHIVLVTKYRKKAINQERLLRLKEIFEQTLVKWECNLVDFNSESDHCHLIVEFKPDIELSKLIANLKTVSSRLIRKEYPDLSKQYFYFSFRTSKCNILKSYSLPSCEIAKIENRIIEYKYSITAKKI